MSGAEPERAAAERSPRHARVSITARVRPILVNLRKEARAGKQVTLGQFSLALGADGPLLLVFLFSLPFLFPISLGPITAPIALVIAFIGFRVGWHGTGGSLPHRFKDLNLPMPAFNAMRKVVLWLASRRKASRRAAERLVATGGSVPISPTMARLASPMMIVGALLLALPIPLLPFTNSLPALSIGFASAGLLKRSASLVWVGFGFLIVSIAYMGAIGAFVAIYGTEALSALWGKVFGA